jgi:hypothetical protein
MKSEKETLLVLTSAGMEIAWRYAWSSFLAFSILQHPFPLPVAISAFAAATYITRLSGRRNWRRIQAALLHTAGFAFAALLIAYRLFFRDAQFFNGAWVADLILQPKAPQQWFILLLVLCCLLLFWLGGRSLEKRSRDYFTVCLQFDKGLGLLFLLLLIKFLIELKGGIRLEDPATGLLVIAFILFSLLSIGLVRGRAGAKKSFLAGYHGIGIILGFTTIVVLCGAALILLTFPYWTQIADSAHSVLKDAAEPLGPVIVKIVRFIFGRSRFQIETGGSGTVGSGINLVDPSPTNPGEVFLRQVIGWGLAGILGLIAVGVFVYLMNRVLRWLLEKNTVGEIKPQSATWIFKLLSLFITIPQGVWNRVLYLLRGFDSAAAVYAGVLCWGRRSGLPPVPSETAGEYGIRLKRQFPKLKEEIEMIIEAFNREVYGKIMIAQRSLAGLAAALNRMRSPRHWPSRMRGWSVQQPLQPDRLIVKQHK